MERNKNLSRNDTVRFPTYTSTEEVSVFDVHRRLRELVHTQGYSQEILLDAQILPIPRNNSNKTWEIELTLFHVTDRVGDWPRGKPYQGFFSCHKTGSFTTYSISIGGRELWFDQHENAISSLSHEGLRAYYRE